MPTASRPSEHTLVTSEDAEAVWFSGCLALIKASTESTGGALALVEFTHPPDFATPPHIHHHEDEAFYILEGTMSGFCGDQQWRATAGDFVWLPRGVVHGYAIEGDQPLRTLAICLPTGFESFVRDAGEPAGERELPPSAEFDVPKLLASAAQHGQEILAAPAAPTV
jgi:mannose-6-phosphate isomerase-like protein (cupin superfamily)